MKLAVLIAASFAVLAPAASAQMNCIGQGTPTQAPPICPNHVAECLCNSDGFDCHPVWTCKPWPAPAPTKAPAAAVGNPAGDSPLGGLLHGILEGQRLRQQMEANRVQQEFIKAQTEAIREETEAKRMRSAEPRAASLPAPPEPVRASESPAVALARDPEFNRLPMAIRIRLVRLVEPGLTKYTDSDIEASLNGIARNQPVPAYPRDGQVVPNPPRVIPDDDLSGEKPTGLPSKKQ